MGDLTLISQLSQIGAAASVVVAVILFMKDRAAARIADKATLDASLNDRAQERKTFSTIIENHLAHTITSTEALATAVNKLAVSIAKCPIRDDGGQ